MCVSGLAGGLIRDFRQTPNLLLKGANNYVYSGRRPQRVCYPIAPEPMRANIMLTQRVLGVHFQGQKAPQTPSLLNSFSIPAQIKIVRFIWNEPAFGSRGPSMRFSTKTRLGYKDIYLVVIYSELRRYNIDVCFDIEFGFENCRSLRSPKKSKDIPILTCRSLSS